MPAIRTQKNSGSTYCVTSHFIERRTGPEVIIFSNSCTVRRGIEPVQNCGCNDLIPARNLRRIIRITAILAQNRTFDSRDVCDYVEFLRVRLAEPCGRGRLDGCVELDPAAVEEGFPQRVPSQGPPAFAAPESPNLR